MMNGIPTKITPEEQEDLLNLFNSPYWKTYWKLLIQIKEAHQLGLLQIEDPNKLLKSTGIVVGLNLAVNQLGVLVAQINEARRVAGESKTSPSPRV